MRSRALARSAAPAIGGGALLLAGAGIFGVGVLAGYLIGRWWKRRNGG